MQVNIEDSSIREYIKEQADAAVRSIVRSEVQALIHKEMEKKLKDLTPHAIQLAINGTIEKEIKRTIDESFKMISVYGIGFERQNDIPLGVIQKTLLALKESLKEQLWDHVSKQLKIDLLPPKKEKGK